MISVVQQKTRSISLLQQIGRFQPFDVSGKRAQGIVYLAEDTQLARKISRTLSN